METKGIKIQQSNHSIIKQFSNNKIDLTAQNIYYNVPIKNQLATCPSFASKVNKTILKGVSIICKSGKITSIMGASGSGKTTLLNVIACRVDMKNVQGALYANSQPYQQQHFGGFANYVMQSDILFQTLTVKQTLQFAANLKINGSQEMKQHTINEIVKAMKLQKCLDTFIGGNILKGVSGGQKKRTSIGFELISDPSVLILDEPTSGLDSLTAFIIVRHLKHLANQGKTIIMTIHQPNYDIFQLFDSLILLHEGNLVYQGNAHQAVTYFQSLGLKCPQFMNPADFLMEIIHPQSSQIKNRKQLYYESYKQKISSKILSQIQNRQKQDITKRNVGVGFCKTLTTLLSRDIDNALRNPMIVKSKLIQGVFIGLFAGGIFYKVSQPFEPTETLQSSKFYSLAGAMFFNAIGAFMSSFAPTSLTFPIQRNIFQKQSSSKLYDVLSYFLSRNIVQFPFLIINPLVTTIIMYWMMGLSATPQQFFFFFLALFMVTLVGASLGLLLGSMIPDPTLVSVLTPIFFVPLIIFSGFFKNRSELPEWIGWIEYISPFKYGFIALTANELENRVSPMRQLNFQMSKQVAIVLLAVLSIGFRIISFIFLYLLKGKQQ